MVSGSHRLFEGEVLGSKELKRRLRHCEFWSRLTDKRLDHRSSLQDFAGEVDGVALKLVELHGDPGDVYFTDLRLLHSVTPNVQPAPRLMVTQRLPTQAGAARIQNCLEDLRQRRGKGQGR